MNNTKTKRWPFILSGISLILYSLLSFIYTLWCMFYDDFQCYFHLPNVSLTYINVPLFTSFCTLILALSFFMKKKNIVSIIASSIILLPYTNIAIRWFLPRYAPYWFNGSGTFYTFLYILLVAGSITLIIALVLGIFRFENRFAKILYFSPAAIQFLYLTCTIMRNLYGFHYKNVTMLSLIDILLYILEHTIYFIALIFVGIACQTPIIKGTPQVVAPQKVSMTLQNNAESIRIYKQLLDDDVISEEEYAQKKKELLNL